MRVLILFLSILMAGAAASAQMTTGSMTIDRGAGRVEGDICLSAIPAEAGHFLLNKGLNITEVRRADDGRALLYMGEHSAAEGAMVGEAIRYRVVWPRAEPQPADYCVRYVGAYPVYPAGTSKIFDFAGVIAFTDRTVRMNAQANWLPTPYDDETGQTFDSTAYDITVDCADCATLYMNGDEPVVAQRHRFESDVAVKPVLFGGDMPIVRGDGLVFVGGGGADAAAPVYSRLVGEIADHFAGRTGLRFGAAPVFVAMERLQESSGLSFASWPTIALGGAADFSDAIEAESGRLAEPTEATLAHEMAHYYFGGVRSAPGPLSLFVGEAFPEWLALSHMTQVYGAAHRREKLGAYHARTMRGEGWRPLSESEPTGAGSEWYRYAYGPLLLAALEERAGAERMNAFVHAVLTADRPANDYALLAEAARAADIPASQWQSFEAECVTPVPAQSCLAAYAMAASAE